MYGTARMGRCSVCRGAVWYSRISRRWVHSNGRVWPNHRIEAVILRTRQATTKPKRKTRKKVGWR